MPVLVTRRAPKSARLTVQSVRRVAEAMLKALSLSEAELSVLLTDDRTIHELNREHRDKDRPTDVLSFPLDEDAETFETGGAEQPRILGDVVISLDTAERQARGRRRPLAEEVRFLLAHGLLHLIGFDHDTAPRKRRMGAMTRRLVRAAPLEATPATAAGKARGRPKPPPKPRQNRRAPKRNKPR